MKNNKLGLTKKQLNYLLAIDYINRRSNIYNYVYYEDIITQLECTKRSYKIITTKLIRKGLIERKTKDNGIEYVKFTKIGYKLLCNLFEELC